MSEKHLFFSFYCVLSSVFFVSPRVVPFRSLLVSSSLTSPPVDLWLVLGSLVFGLGWALGGFCPGPSVVGMMSGQLDYVMFSYGLYFSIVGAVIFRRGFVDPFPNWLLTVALGLLPLLFYFFPLLHVPPDAHWETWPLHLSICGGLLIGMAAFLLMATTGRTLGVR